MTGIRVVATGVVVAGLVVGCGVGAGQGLMFNSPTLDTAMRERNAFIDRIGEDGFYCRLPAPAIVVADTPLFGRFDRGSNNIITPEWKQLTAQEKAVFADLAGPGGTDAQAQAIFDVEAHHWMLIVGEVHWWEACKQLTLKLTPYEAEMQATRVTLAYWRERDPEVVARLTAVVDALGKEPSLIPPGQDLPTYFNQHYLTTASGREYLWLQTQLVKIALADEPEPILVETLKRLE